MKSEPPAHTRDGRILRFIREHNVALTARHIHGSINTLPGKPLTIEEVRRGIWSLRTNGFIKRAEVSFLPNMIAQYEPV